MTRPLLFAVTGPPASGKTSVAKELAKRLGVPFFSAESNFDAETDVAPFRRFAEEHDAEVVQTHIGGEAEALVEEFTRRAASGERHPGHHDDPTDADELRAKLRAGHWEPLALPGLLVEADMHDDEEAIVERVRAALER